MSQKRQIIVNKDDEEMTKGGEGTLDTSTHTLGVADTLASDPEHLISRASIKKDAFAGLRLDHFIIEEKLGEGGMGAVFLAEDTSLKRKVAIKILPAQLALSHELRQRFLREARAQGRLQSAHVAHIYFIGETPVEIAKDSHYFALELINGGSLADFTEEGAPFELEEARRWMIEVARGLQDAQHAGIVHRDIKPSNLLLDERRRIKIVDFGVAKPIDEGEHKITRVGVIVGSPNYMAPEQALGEEIDFRADMYSMGCTFYHLLSGRIPFDGANAFSVANKHVNEPLPSLGQIAPHLPEKLISIIETLCSKKAEDRFESYDDLIEALEAAKPQETLYGSFWARGAAFLLDLVAAGVLIGSIGWTGLFLHLAYVSFANGRWGKTLGKLAFHLRVVGPGGGPLGYGRSIARTITLLWLPVLVGLFVLVTQGTSEFVASVEAMTPTQSDAFHSWLIATAVSNGLMSILYFAGLALAAFHPKAQGVHDLVVNSRVIYELRGGPRRGHVAINEVVKRSVSGIKRASGSDQET